MTAEVVSPVDRGAGSGLWLAASAGPSVALPIHRPLEPVVAADLVLPVAYPRFTVNGERAFGERSPVSARSGLSVRMRFRDDSVPKERPAAALALLDRHDREIRPPQMDREAWLLQAEALCRAGRVVDGRRVVARILERWPSLPAISEVRQLCERAESVTSTGR